MKIQEAIKSIGEKAMILKSAADKTSKGKKETADFITMMLEQYNETDGNKDRMNKIFGSEVMKCIIEHARMINAFADIELANRQSEEENH